MEYHAIATLVRESIATPPNDDRGRADLAVRAVELGLPPMVVQRLQRLWTTEGWVSLRVLQDDVAPSVIWN